jgi:MFS family permease
MAGMALDRWGARLTFGAGAAFLATGLFLSSTVRTLWELVLSYGVVAGLGITILGLGPQAGMISRWFRRRRGLALGLAFAGTGLGTLTLTPGSEYLISVFDWRTAYRALGALALLTIPFIWTFLRLRPEDAGIQPDGDAIRPEPQEVSGARRLEDSLWTMGMAIRTPSFWLVMVTSVGAIGPVRMLTVHQLAAITDAGFERSYAANMVGLSGAMTAISFILFGMLSDRIGRRAVYAVGSVSLLAAILILNDLASLHLPVWVLIYAIALGLGEGTRASLVTAVASDLFPGPSMGAITGTVGAGFGIGAAILPWLAGYLYDRTGHYQGAFLIAAVAILLSAIALWLALSNRHQRVAQNLTRPFE